MISLINIKEDEDLKIHKLSKITSAEVYIFVAQDLKKSNIKNQYLLFVSKTTSIVFGEFVNAGKITFSLVRKFMAKYGRFCQY